MSWKYIRTEYTLQCTRANLVEVPMQNTRRKECRRANEFEEFNVIIAAESRVDANCKFNFCGFTNINSKLLNLSASIFITSNELADNNVACIVKASLDATFIMDDGAKTPA